jgi:hypothetical protein
MRYEEQKAMEDHVIEKMNSIKDEYKKDHKIFVTILILMIGAILHIMRLLWSILNEIREGNLRNNDGVNCMSRIEEILHNMQQK